MDGTATGSARVKYSSQCVCSIELDAEWFLKRKMLPEGGCNKLCTN